MQGLMHTCGEGFEILLVLVLRSLTEFQLVACMVVL